ncbi:MAG: SurA N-terminal domain-containing protein [Alphaproteobacteria bacterium]|nr:SurA N-terminal domain-containing protein [Alphaproteobacteria bacterium]
MLAAMRNTVSGIFAKTLLFFLVVTFAVWGIGDIVRGGPTDGTLVRVGESDITAQEFGRELQMVQRNAEGSIPPEVLNSPMLRQQVLERMVQTRLMRTASSEMGLAIGDALLAKHTKENPLFQNVDGTFNAEAFMMYLKQSQQNEAMYRKQSTQELSEGLYTRSAELDQLRMPEAYANLLTLNRMQRRSAKLITIAANDTIALDDAELKAYYETQKDSLYMQPETRSIQLAIIDKATITKLTKGDGNAFEELSYTVDDAVAAGSSLKEALDSAKLTATIKTLNVSADAGNSELEREVVAQAFTLNDGEASSLLSSKEGEYFMVGVNNITPATPKAFEAVKQDVITHCREDKGAELAKENALALKKKLNGEASLDAQIAAAQAAGASVRDTGLLARPDVSASKDIPEALHHGMFDADKGDVIGPVALDKGGYALAIVSDINIPSDAKADDKAIGTMRAQLNSQLYQYWMRDVMQRYPVSQVGAMPEQQQ